MKNSISCDAHDYFEIVCMRRSLIKVTAKDNKIYHADIPQSRLDELLAQRKKTPTITKQEPQQEQSQESAGELTHV